MSDTIIDAWDTIVKCERMDPDKNTPVSGLEPLTRRDVALLRLAAILTQKWKDDEYPSGWKGDDRKRLVWILEPVLEKLLGVEVSAAELGDALVDVIRRHCDYLAYEIIS